jgi:NAD(P)-dependent dehydrogenase (short-subunit alcohol dehydrogenase family)
VSESLRGRVVIVSGAGQTPGSTIGNGRATAVLFARHGSRVLCVDRDGDAAAQTAQEVAAEGGEAVAWQADVTQEEAIEALVAECMSRWGRIDVLHNNVGISVTGGDAPITEIEVEAFDRVTSVNLKSVVLTCKHVLPIMREQRRGVICNISSVAAVVDYPYIAYRTSKAGVITLTESVAIRNAQYGIRANTILPGLLNTPMAIEGRVQRLGANREELIAERDAQVPLGKMGTGWDVAHAAVFLASDEAQFITGATLTVDGGQALAVSRSDR